MYRMYSNCHKSTHVDVGGVYVARKKIFVVGATCIVQDMKLQGMAPRKIFN